MMREILEWNLSLAVITDKKGNTPLHYAASIGNIYDVRKLLFEDTLESVYKANLSGSFPVHLAAEAGNVKVIKELLSKCPDVGELLDKEERNFLHIALHLSVINSESEIFVLLSKNKRVNQNIRNKAGLTPLDISASFQDQSTHTLNPQSIIHRALLIGGGFQNPCQPDLSKIVHNLVKKDGARADCPNQREGKEMWNGGVDREKKLTKYEDTSKSLTTGAVLIASVTFAAIFTVSIVYRDDNTSDTLISRRTVLKAFVVADMAAFILATVCTIWLLYTALSNFDLKYRKLYFEMCAPLLYGAINIFILAFGLAGYIAIAPLSEWPALLILVVSGIAFLWNIIWSPKFVPLFLLGPYITTKKLQ